MKKDLFIKKLVKNLRNQSKTLGTCSNGSQFISCYNPYVQVNSRDYYTSSVFNSKGNAKVKAKKVQ